MAYASSTKIDQLLSADGSLRRLDDNSDSAADAGLLTAMIELADSQIDQYCLQRYTTTVLAANTWVQWAASHIAARLLCRRRGNVPPEPIEMAAKAYMEHLKEIKEGHSEVPGAAAAYDDSPSVTNYHVNGAYRFNKLRRVQQTSTTGNQGEGLKRHNNQEWSQEN